MVSCLSISISRRKRDDYEDLSARRGRDFDNSAAGSRCSADGGSSESESSAEGALKKSLFFTVTAGFRKGFAGVVDLYMLNKYSIIACS